MEPFTRNGDVEEYAGKIAGRAYKDVVDFAMSDLKRILIECVECKEPDRTEIDEKTVFKAVMRLTLGTIHAMSTRLLILKAYEIERMIGRNGKEPLPHISSEIVGFFPGWKNHFDGIVAFLNDQGSERVKYLLECAAAEASWDHNFTKLILGRSVWNNLYQPLQCNFREPSSPYTVLFG